MFNKIVAVDYTGIEEFVRQDLEDISKELIMYNDIPKNNQEIIKRAQGADALLVSWNTPIDAEVIQALPDLKYIGMCCSLLDENSANVNIKAAREHNIPVLGVKDYGDEGVVEFIFSELIRLIKGLGQNQLYSEQIELSSLKLGIIGMGTLGKMVADAGRFFGMEVSYYSRSKKDLDYPYQSLKELLRNSDVISCHLPRHAMVLDQEALEEFSGNKILINTGLTPSYDPQAFKNWIQSNYAIFDQVSLPENLLETYSKNPRVIISNKVSGFTKNARQRLAIKVVENLKKISLG